MRFPRASLLILLLLLVFGTLAYSLYLGAIERPRSLPGPELPPPPFALGAPTSSLSGATFWYNFTVGSAASGARWNETRIVVAPGYLGGLDPNGSVWVSNASLEVVAQYANLSGGNWTTTSQGPVLLGETVVLRSDRWLSGATLEVFWSWPSAGGLSVAIP